MDELPHILPRHRNDQTTPDDSVYSFPPSMSWVRIHVNVKKGHFCSRPRTPWVPRAAPPWDANTKTSFYTLKAFLFFALKLINQKCFLSLSFSLFVFLAFHSACLKSLDGCRTYFELVHLLCFCSDTLDKCFSLTTTLFFAGCPRDRCFSTTWCDLTTGYFCSGVTFLVLIVCFDPLSRSGPVWSSTTTTEVNY